MGRPNPSRETKLSGANEDGEMFSFPVQLTTSRIRNLPRFIHTLLYVMCNAYLSISRRYFIESFSNVFRYCYALVARVV